MKRYKKRILRKIGTNAAATSSAFVLQAITLSHETRAFAECSSEYGNTICLEIDDICMGAEETVNVDGSFYYSAGDDTHWGYQADVSFSDVTVPSPIFSSISGVNLNNYPTGAPPGTREEDFQFSLTSPEVDFATNRITASIEATGNTRDYSGSWGDVWWTLVGTQSVYVDHLNLAPIIAYIDPSADEVTIEEEGESLAVSAVFQDEESNNLNIVFELSTDEDFNNIIQTSTTYNVDSNNLVGVLQAHTFDDLSEGQYYWRVIATETDAAGICSGILGGAFYRDGTNYEVSSDEEFPVPVVTVESPTVDVPETNLLSISFPLQIFFGLLLLWFGTTVFLIMNALRLRLKKLQKCEPKVDLTQNKK